MKRSTFILIAGTVLSGTISSWAQAPAGPAFEALPTLSAAAILQPQYLQGVNFTVRDPVPTSAGSNQYFIDSDFGTFEADGNAMLIRRVAEIIGIAQLKAISKTNEFTQAAAQAALAPIGAAKDLVTDPVQAITSVPRGIWGLLNRTGQAVKEVADGAPRNAEQGGAVSNISGFAKTKRDLAIKLGVDPYTDNTVFQQELSKVAWPAFMGKFVVNTGLGAISGGVGTAISAITWNASLNNSLVDKSPTDLRLMNLGLLMNDMGVSREDADAFLYNGAISPTTQTVLVAALDKLGNIPGQADFIRAAATCQDEHDALAYMQSVQMMAKLNETTPVARILQVQGFPLCQLADGTVAVTVQWDFAAWTPTAEKFLNALQAQKFATPATGYNVTITGVVSPAAAQALAARKINLTTKSLTSPLN